MSLPAAASFWGAEAVSRQVNPGVGAHGPGLESSRISLRGRSILTATTQSALRGNTGRALFARSRPPARLVGFKS